jgi:hypothetical protein
MRGDAGLGWAWSALITTPLQIGRAATGAKRARFDDVEAINASLR